MFEQPYDALNWLCEKSGQNYIYALLRYGAIFRHPESRRFQACIALAEALHDEVDYVTRLIQHYDWRNQVIGNIVAVLNHEAHYELAYTGKLTSGRVRFPS